MKKFFKRNILTAFLTLIAAISFGQNINTELRFLDLVEDKTYAGLYFTNISKSQFEQIKTKVNSLNVYTVKSEFFSDKNKAVISLVSNVPVSVGDFQGVLKQLEIVSVDYNGKKISVQEIESNYKPLNKTEVVNKQRN